MKIRHSLALYAALLAGVAGCGDAAPFDTGAHEQEVLQWRAERLERLTAPMGYLAQAGLFWLDEGTYRFGGDTGDDIVFAGPAAPDIGEFIVNSAGIRMFNKAYSPPCAFNVFSTCPVASPRNRLPIRSEAVEKHDPALHYSGD